MSPSNQAAVNESAPDRIKHGSSRVVTPSADRHDPFTRIVGQRRVIPFLRKIRDGIALGAHPHPLLFHGRSGHGKTALSKAFADSIGAEFVRIDCGPELKSENLVERLIGIKSLAVVFCDEMQSMRKRAAWGGFQRRSLFGVSVAQRIGKIAAAWLGAWKFLRSRP